jgi:hydrogenase/urease accessory protein HupE
MRAARLILWVVLLLATAMADAHEVRPGYLDLREVAPDRFEVMWKVPALGDYRLGIYVVLPENCSGAPSQGSFVGSTFVERWQATCTGSLVGRRVGIDGLSATKTDVLVRVERLDGTTQTARLTPAETSFEVTASPSRFEVAKTYLLLGVEHILLGVDHLLFVLGLLFLCGNWHRLLVTITAFTVAHSMTLAAATLGLVHVPQAPVEATIALSVMFVAVEVLRRAHGATGLAARFPWIVAFVFGLLHGFGFAGALREVGLPEKNIPVALLFFNLGVEVGQILFIAAVSTVLLLVARLATGSGREGRNPWQSRSSIRTPIAYVIGSVAAFWVVQRVAAF